MVLGNLFFAILMRNELFGRFLYWFVNTFFAKWTPLWWRLGCTSVLQVDISFFLHPSYGLIGVPFSISEASTVDARCLAYSGLSLK